MVERTNILEMSCYLCSVLDIFRIILKILNLQDIYRDIAVLEMYFSEIAYEEITTIEAYDLFSLVCDIGGALGLMLGATIITLFEILDFFIVSCVSCETERYRSQPRLPKRKTKNTNANIHVTTINVT